MTGAAEPDDELKAQAAELLANCQIADVRASMIRAELVEEYPGEITTVTFNPVLAFAASPGVFRNRFTYDVSFQSDDGEPAANMSFVLIVEWLVTEGYEPTRGAAEFVANTTGYFAAFAYARELIQQMTTRLGLDPVVLGALKRHHLKPGAIGIVKRGSGIDGLRADAEEQLGPAEDPGASMARRAAFDSFYQVS